jgi:hypothetical protein
MFAWGSHMDCFWRHWNCLEILHFTDSSMIVCVYTADKSSLTHDS